MIYSAGYYVEKVKVWFWCGELNLLSNVWPENPSATDACSTWVQSSRCTSCSMRWKNWQLRRGFRTAISTISGRYWHSVFQEYVPVVFITKNACNWTLGNPSSYCRMLSRYRPNCLASAMPKEGIASLMEMWAPLHWYLLINRHSLSKACFGTLLP